MVLGAPRDVSTTPAILTSPGATVVTAREKDTIPAAPRRPTLAAVETAGRKW